MHSSTKTGVTILLAVMALAVVVEVKAQALSDDRSLSLDSSSRSESLNSTVTESTTKKPLPEVPKITMDIITVIWYLSTFLALAAFFFLMACSDRRCGRSRIETDQSQIPPPTPAPSYSEFAPPSYEAVMKQYHNVYVLPVSVKIPEKKPADIKYHTVNELHKIG